MDAAMQVAETALVQWAVLVACVCSANTMTRWFYKRRGIEIGKK